jgi:hypothetical protein
MHHRLSAPDLAFARSSVGRPRALACGGASESIPEASARRVTLLADVTSQSIVSDGTRSPPAPRALSLSVCVCPRSRSRSRPLAALGAYGARRAHTSLRLPHGPSSSHAPAVLPVLSPAPTCICISTLPAVHATPFPTSVGGHERRRSHSVRRRLSTRGLCRLSLAAPAVQLVVVEPRPRRPTPA